MVIHITGSTGFVGRSLVSSLNSPEIKVNPVMIRDANWKESLTPFGDIIINLVGKAHDHKSQATEQEYYYANVELTKEIFFAFVNSTSKLLIHISSLAAVEEFESRTPLEEENRCHPVSWYGKTKREAEKWLLNQTLPKDKKVVIIRPPMIHGPGDKGNLRLLYKIISKGIPYPLASFDNKRSFISIENFIFFIHRIIEDGDLLQSGVYHVSDDDYISTLEIIEIIKHVSGKKVLNIGLPKFLIKGIAKVGDFIPIPLNSRRLKKMTGDLLVSNKKIKFALSIDSLPLTAKEGIIKTINDLSHEED